MAFPAGPRCKCIALLIDAQAQLLLTFQKPTGHGNTSSFKYPFHVHINQIVDGTGKMEPVHSTMHNTRAKTRAVKARETHPRRGGEGNG
jgi:hypothetical protein